VHFTSLEGESKNKVKVLKSDFKGQVIIPFEGKISLFVRFVGYENLFDTLNTNKNVTYKLQPTSIMLNEIVTTGQFSPQSIQNSVYPVNIISEERIVTQAATNLRDLLQTQLNVRISQDNILGSSISINGISGQNVKVMVDGVPVLGRLQGNIDVSQINMNNVQKVEIIEGPMSTIYGTDALGGVVNIITKDAKCDRMEFVGNAFYESVGSANFDGALQINLFEDHNFSLSGGRNFFGGYSVVDTSRHMQWKPKIQYTANFKYGTDIGNFKLRYSARYFNEYILNRGTPRPPYFEDAFDDEYRTDRITNSIFFNGNISKNQYIDLLFDYSYYVRKKNTYFKDLTTLKQVMTTNEGDQDTTMFDNYIFRGSYSWDDPYKVVGVLAGTELNFETAEGRRIEDSTKNVGDYAVYTSLNYRPFEELQIQPSIRLIHNTAYEAPIVPALNIKFSGFDGVTLRASYAKGFRAPSLRELYYIFVDVNHQIYGNANLKAEQSDTWNCSADYRIQNEMNVHDITAKLYYNDIKNLVDFAFIGNDKYSYVNIGNYKSVGGEISTNYYSANINTQLGFSYIGRYNHLSESYDTPEFTYSPEFQGNILWKLPFYRNLQLGLFYKYTGKMPGYGLTTNEELVLYTMNDYSIMDLTATLNMFDNNISLQIGAKNLFDVKQIQQSIATVQGAHSTGAVMMPVGWGRTIFATLKVNFNKMWDK
jgi:outer membrane receptor for ferrienterochelin and colicins